MHRLLQRQLRKVFPNGLPDDPKLQQLISLVESGYDAFSEQLTILERSLDISSEELNHRNRTLNTILDSLPDMSLWIDKEGVVRDIRVGSFEPPLISAECKTEQLFELPFVQQSPELYAFLRDHQNTTKQSRDVALHFNGHEYLVKANLTAISQQRWLLVLQDIYLRKKLEEMQNQRLQQSKRAEKQLQQLVNSAPIGILICNPRLNVLMSNDFLCHLFGMTKQELMNQHPMEYIAIQYRAVFKQFVDKALCDQIKTDIQRLDLMLMLPDGRDIPVEMAFSKIVFEGKPMVIISITDISERKQLEEMLRNLAATDPLTGALNRRSFMEQAEKSTKTCKRWDGALSLLILDIDYFKRFNDTYGHAAGDIVLVELVKLIQKSIREIDFVGRLGGEEFAVVLPGLGGKEAYQVAERLRQVVESMQIFYDQQALNMTISIGLASLSSSELDTPFEILMKTADEGLYCAKNHGRNCVITSQ
ncbi:TPA: sensor domain-containing diguanylate cyclase [Vibrio vulnificus]|nr:GGDEF domain-containing protein [Vibrio vulnificus]ELP5730160.1 GGDEF domain-containing protein [Vibrio vulnificus]ELP8108883.1 GGDEF domain-containing protein [Vibrio vulnificus]HAS8123066.1 sensor domain-containing diguanylate cyclase [Vibrio vulnificus]HAS8312047.1 sensor domain-containing diguanylate cyclase [Vibrio vulnificus]